MTAAAHALKDEILGMAAEMLDRSPATLMLRGDRVTITGGAAGELPAGVPAIALAEIAAEFDRIGKSRRVRGVFDLTPLPPSPGDGTTVARRGGDLTPLPSPPLLRLGCGLRRGGQGGEEAPDYLPLFVTGAHAAEVEVDLRTGETRVLRMAAAHDVGRVVNRLDAEGQIEGALVMGIGAALMEEVIPGHTRGFADYYLPTAKSMPQTDVILVEVPGLHGPHGVKGLGEAAMLPATPAIINAISRDRPAVARDPGHAGTGAERDQPPPLLPVPSQGRGSRGIGRASS